jgi:hypothetical protein
MGYGEGWKLRWITPVVAFPLALQMEKWTAGWKAYPLAKNAGTRGHVPCIEVLQNR